MKHINIVSGQSLIEIVVATGIIALVLVGVSDLITRSLALSNFQADRNKSVNVAQNQLTYYRQQRDIHPADFFIDPNINYSICVGEIDAKYTCSISYTEVAGKDGYEMSVVVSWIDGGKSVETILQQTLAKPTK